MGLFNALGVAIGGISQNQARTDLAARNIGQSDIQGYTAKTLDISTYSGKTISSGSKYEVNRHIDTFLQQQFFSESSIAGTVEVQQNALTQLDNLFGTPGDADSLTELYDSFLSNLNALSANPESASQLNTFIGKAQLLAKKINHMGHHINTLRINSHNNIQKVAKEANTLMSDIANYNRKIAEQSFESSFSKTELQDQVDQKILELSRIVNVETQEQNDGSKKVFLQNGTLLSHFTPAQLSIDTTKQIEPWQRYSRFSDSDIPKIMLNYQNTSQNILDDNLLTDGKMYGYTVLRDDTLVKALDDLDSFAASIASTASQYTVIGQQTNSGNGMSIDISSIQYGDELNLAITDNNGTSKTLYFYNTSHTDLSEEKMALLGKNVHEIDFSQDINTVANNIATALGSDYTVSVDTNGLLQIESTINTINNLTANITSNDINANRSSIPLFTDGKSGVFTNNMEGIPQIQGFSMRINLNENLLNQPKTLVEKTINGAIYTDGNHAAEMHQRLSSSQAFRSLPGLENTLNSQTTMNIASYANNFVSHYATKASDINSEKIVQDNLVSRISDQYQNKHSVNIEEEMTNLVILQNSFSANARMVTAINEMLDELFRM